MSEEQITIASAVIVPEAEGAHDQPSPPPPPKRRQSSVSETSSKRPRLSAEVNEQPRDEELSSDRRGGRRKSGQAEERKRGQRLFGALLGTLSQSSSTTQKRRADIEKKQQAKLKVQAEEYDEKKKQDLEGLLIIRRKEQKKFDEQSMRIRHSNLLAMAHFLHTTTEPRLYYKPWEPLPGDEAKVKAQIEEAEATIEQELTDFNTRRQKDRERSGTTSPAPAATQNDATGDTEGKVAATTNGDTVGTVEETTETHEEGIDHPTNHEPMLDADTAPNTGQANPKENVEDGDGGDVVLEAAEDTVIY
ncbi:MAG: hypothetical protein M1833_002950 [Piccolia ochrophora]|nr:MAG: hypothetical protein M1833_002950 [Piccolia ochrophora]